MEKANITEYKTAPGSYIAYYGRAIIKDNYEFVNGDEAFYHFIGKNSGYSLLNLLHPDDVKDFQEVVKALGNGRQCTIVRMKDAYDNYRLLYLELELNGRFYGDFPSFDLDFCNFMELKDRYVKYMELIKKYREFMGLSDNMFFEYSDKTDELNIYRYVNIKSVPVLRKPLAEIRKSIGASSEFEVFCDFLKRGVERFNASFDANLLMDNEQGRYQLRGATLYDDGVRTMTVGIIRSVDAKEKMSYYLTDNAFDPGTGLYNKRAIQEYALEKTREGKELYLAMIDVDDFKNVNDRFGHMFGDEVLSKVSEIMRGVIDSRGMVGRFGGDEFMLVLDGVSDEEELRRIFKTISKNMQWEYQDIKDTLAITTSCGIAKFPKDAANFEDLFKKADKALYVAKEKGKNRYIIYDEARHGTVEDAEISERSIGIKAIASDDKKAAVMSDMILLLNAQGTGAFDVVMEKVRNYLDVDGIAVYAGRDLHKVWRSGRYFNAIESLACIKSEDYQKQFDKRGIYAEKNFGKLAIQYPEVHKLYQTQENKEFVQCASRSGDEIRAVVSFDYFNRAPKIGTADLGFITIVGRLIAEIASGLE
ncbi:MAG: GGDEF domain-containing protein [Lachnospiraceae bacterium]|nr:GGDEF domain-containing protein [Lachnospiraceae bacterium]